MVSLRLQKETFGKENGLHQAVYNRGLAEDRPELEVACQMLPLLSGDVPGSGLALPHSFSNVLQRVEKGAAKAKQKRAAHTNLLQEVTASSRPHGWAGPTYRTVLKNLPA